MLIDLSFINNFYKDGLWDCEELKKHFIVKNKENTLLIKYKKHKKKSLGLFRSVVLNELGNVCCISPPKSIKYDSKKSYKMYEFVEGTMINSWYDATSTSWRISSKSILDANNTFSEKQTKSFHDLFFESCEETRFSLDMLDKNQCYSFVFKHPENRIINKVNKPELYLISAYRNLNNNTFEYIDYTYLQDLTFKTGLRLPTQYFESHISIYHQLNSTNTPIDNMGVVLRQDGSSLHSKIRNKAYEIIKKLKTNNTKLIYTYINSKKHNLDDLYLQVFPEHIDDFNVYSKQLDELILKLYNTYYFAVKEKMNMIHINEHYKFHIKNIHTYYIQNLYDRNLYIRENDIYNYLFSDTRYINQLLNLQG